MIAYVERDRSLAILKPYLRDIEEAECFPLKCVSIAYKNGFDYISPMSRPCYRAMSMVHLVAWK